MTWKLNVSTEEDFWRRVSIGDKRECWEWQGRRNKEGYGIMEWEGHTLETHRISWKLNYHSLGRYMQVRHSCKNKVCVNPFHLYTKEI